MKEFIKLTLQRLLVVIYFLWLCGGTFGLPIVYVIMETDEKWYNWICVAIYYLPFLYIKEIDNWSHRIAFGSCK